MGTCTYNESSRGRGRFNNQEHGCGHSINRGRWHNNQNQQYFRRSQDAPYNITRKGANMTQEKCKRCLQNGHIEKECRTRNENLPQHQKTFNSKQSFKSNASTSAQYVDNQEDGFEYVFTANQELDFADSIATNNLMRKDYDDDWILDTGATQHMCYIKYYFWTY